MLPDQAGTLQSREISVQISLWNREEEHADDDGSSGDGGKDQRTDIQRARRWNGEKDQKIYINMETDGKIRFHKHRILSEIQRLRKLLETRKKQNDNPIQKNIRGEENLPRNIE
ncbi:MAG: hypothetical protein EZS28_038419 [Streblomastix strix]|uniref:Uncharacterized protein n=1 Tax=Streblomastix strix TaxID=222440 RepID=A0A5J4U793_9EUKA|nr:MAG: hypothetical protein EZS28_038419 [Streblomastix strix]